MSSDQHKKVTSVGAWTCGLCLKVDPPGTPLKKVYNFVALADPIRSITVCMKCAAKVHLGHPFVVEVGGKDTGVSKVTEEQVKAEREKKLSKGVILF